MGLLDRRKECGGWICSCWHPSFFLHFFLFLSKYLFRGRYKKVLIQFFLRKQSHFFLHLTWHNAYLQDVTNLIAENNSTNCSEFSNKIFYVSFDLMSSLSVISFSRNHFPIVRIQDEETRWILCRLCFAILETAVMKVYPTKRMVGFFLDIETATPQLPDGIIYIRIACKTHFESTIIGLICFWSHENKFIPSKIFDVIHQNKKKEVRTSQIFPI